MIEIQKYHIHSVIWVVEDEEGEEGEEVDYWCCLLLPIVNRMTYTWTIATIIGEVVHIDSINLLKVVR